MSETPVQFSTVFERELKEIDKRRAGEHRKPPPPAVEEHQQEKSPIEEAQAVHKLREDALKKNLVGLAISGGGIRSATFALGVLMGLARYRMLGMFDYLSTVSGGGFLGGWFAAWIKRDGKLSNVEQQLDPDRVQQSKAERAHGAKGVKLDDEPEPVQHLRAYGNYLAPRMNLFSLDGWALLAIYLRNLLLNQIVLLTFVVGVLCFILLVAKSYRAGVDASFAGAESYPNVIHYCLGVGLGSLFIGSILLLCLHRFVSQPPGTGRQRSRWYSTESLHFCLAFAFLLVAAWACSFVAIRLQMQQAPEWPFRFREDTSPYQMHDWLCVFASVGMSLHLGITLLSWLITLCVTRQHHPSISGYVRPLFAALVAGTTGGVLAFCVLKCLAPANKDDFVMISLLFLLGPPLLLVVFILANMLNLGLMGNQVTEAEREFWAATAARLIRYAALAVLLLALVMYGPMLMYLLFNGTAFSLLSSAALGSWAAFILASLQAAQSKDTGDAPGRNIVGIVKEGLAQLGIWVFVGGILIGISFLVWRLVHPSEKLSEGAEGACHFLKTFLTFSFQDLAWQEVCYINALIGGLIGVFGGIFLGCLVNINIFSLQGVYANRLIRCYLGASRPKERTDEGDRQPGAPTNNKGDIRNPHPVTGFDPQDDLPLARLQYGATTDETEPAYDGPLVLINTALNLVQGEELAWSERKADAFVMTPYYCGSYSTGYTPTVSGSAPTQQASMRSWRPGEPPPLGFGGGMTLGTAMSISGAAVSPNMGFHSSAGVTLFLTLFNARLGAWVGNPAGLPSMWTGWQDPITQRRPVYGLFYLLREMFGRTNSRDEYIYLSDGGHFENLGVYELLRRRCRFILLIDGGADGNFTLEDLGNLVRKARVDFGIEIELDLNALRRKPPAKAGAHVVVGKIHYDRVHREENEPRQHNPAEVNWNEGVLVYIKPTLTGDESADLENYQAEHPVFPNDPTTDQFFSEARLESYRMLGYHSAVRVLEPIWRQNDWVYDGKERPDPCTYEHGEEIFKLLLRDWHPAPPDFVRQYLDNNEQYVQAHQLLRTETGLRFLAGELRGEAGRIGDPARTEVIRQQEYHMVAQLMTVLENAWIGLQLERYHRYPVMGGWVRVFRRWASSPILQQHWKLLEPEFNQRFCEFFQRLIDEENASRAAPVPPASTEDSHSG